MKPDTWSINLKCHTKNLMSPEFYLLFWVMIKLKYIKCYSFAFCIWTLMTICIYFAIFYWMVISGYIHLLFVFGSNYLDMMGIIFIHITRHTSDEIMLIQSVLHRVPRVYLPLTWDHLLKHSLPVSTLYHQICNTHLVRDGWQEGREVFRCNTISWFCSICWF